MRHRVLALLLLLSAWQVAAQTTASLTGTVSGGGEPMPGVLVTVTSPALLGERTTVTGPSGNYSLVALPPGSYDVTFAFPGAQPVTKSATLQLSQTTRVDAAMSIQAAETITVASTTPPALESPHISTTLALEEVERLPHQRNQLATAQLAPGVNANVLSNGQLQISGGPGYDNLVLVNGVVVTENSRSQMRPMYVEDAIVETTLLTGAVTAEYGRFTGGVVSTITKSGGEAYNGSLRDSLSNPRWSSTSPANEERENNLNHVWEATLGGSMVDDRLWFFTAGRWAKNDTARQTVAVPASTGNVPSPASPRLSYSESNDQKRYEGKLTARLSSAHSLVGSYFGIDTQTENSRFSNNIYDDASLTGRDEPESLIALRYLGQLAEHFLLEAQYSRRAMSLSSGAFTRDLIEGTVLLDRANSNTRFGSPSLCAICEDERRDNDDVLVKAHYFLDGVAGSHDLVAGIDRFREQRFLEDHQSGSDFAVFVTRAQYKDGVIYPVVTPTNQNGGGTFIRWMPILVAARENDLRTDSVFLNDRWTPSSRWSISAGVRYDRNDAVDADGVTTADDDRISPRLSVQFDPSGDGRHRITASYAEYASRVGDGIAAANQASGSAAAIDFAYRGPAINDKALNVPMDEVLRMLFDYFNNTQGGTGNTSNQNLRPNGSRDVPGHSAYFDGSLSTPYVRELTLGYGAEIGANGFARVDLVSRDWRDFYAASVTSTTRRETTPLRIPVDLALIRNSNGIERRYRAVLLQARWNPSRYAIGVHYTWSKLRGNDEGDSANGPVSNLDPALYYPELMNYERANPIGDLQGDQRHRLRAWIDYSFGPFSASILQTFDSGLAYSITAPINVSTYSGAPANPGYSSIPNGRYFISDRGALRTDDVSSTNLAVRFRHNVFGAEMFLQGDLLNVFDRASIADPQRLGSGVQTAANATGLQTFNPFTTTPVEGTHYRLASNFGQPLNNLAFQTPRTYRFSLGLRF